MPLFLLFGNLARGGCGALPVSPGFRYSRQPLSPARLLHCRAIGSSAIALYAQDARTRLAQTDRLERIERSAEVRQKNAQLKRDYSAPLWVTDQTYGPGMTYEVSGVRKIEVPVLLGPQLDTAVCIGSMGPEGFVQNVNSPFCVGY